MTVFRRAAAAPYAFLWFFLLRLSIVAPKEVEIAWPKEFRVNLETTLTASSSFLSQSQADAYRTYMNGCYDAFSKMECDQNERKRVEINAKQPPLQRNVTDIGYATHKAPDSVLAEIRRFLRRAAPQPDYRYAANIHTNHWVAPTTRSEISFTNSIVQPVQTILEQWCGATLVPTAFDGVRSYPRGSIVAPHLDRIPLVVSALINVEQVGMESDWILQLVPHAGVPVNITLQPGEMVLYESHSVVHGWPYPLQGQSYSNVMMHFEPVGFSSQQFPSPATTNTEALWAAALEQNAGRPKSKPVQTLPSYIPPDSLEASRWFQEFVFERVAWNKPPELTPNKVTYVSKDVLPPDAHRMAARGDVNSLKILAEQNPAAMTNVDDNGWSPIHEAARSGQIEVMEYLLDRHGVDINQRTGKKQRGGSALWWAEKNMVGNKKAIQYMKEKGAKSIPPDV